MALPAYRSILRAARIAFEGDTPVLFAARAAAREGFKNARDAEPEEARGMVSHALDVAKILRENVVQGKQVEDGSYRLRIHEHTERGDNESIKQAKAAMPAGKGCC